ncbi:DsbA family protein [Emcibacter sp.]|uniref:DsbA family protein n=1 Tax=Emcibacter sp. TaxID=1979954 RepID=UPI002AA8D185|nr:thioredoxin domain-containing protein [Emcibacter sp.]
MTKQLNTLQNVISSLFLGLVLLMVPAVQKAMADEATPVLNYDIVLGDADAPVEVIEYASTTCPHCAHFSNEVWPDLEKKYVETGKVRYIFRHFMLNAIDMDASIISRCAAEKRYYPLLSLIFKKQNSWYQPKKYRELVDQYGQETGFKMFSSQTRDEVIKVARMAGVSQADADRCLADTAIRDYLINSYKEGIEKYEVNSTPTFIINGVKHEGGYNFEDFDKAISDALKK